MLFLRIPLGLVLVVAMVLGAASCSEKGGSRGSGDVAAATLKLEITYPHPFSYLSGVRELADGSLLAADPLGQVLLKLDMEAGTADTLGRVGQGPQEYQQPDHVLFLPGDSTLLVDLGNGRLTVVDQKGEFWGWAPMSQPSEDGTVETLRPLFADESGFLYHLASMSQGEGPPDSIALLRTHRASGVRDTVGFLWFQDPSQWVDDKRPAQLPMDDWAVGRDGRIAIVRVNGFSVDWRFPDGRVLHGPSHEMEEFPVSQADMEAALTEIISGTLFTTSVRDESGAQTRQMMSRGVPSNSGLRLTMDSYHWPESLPPFLAGGTLVSPQGEAWVQRMMPVAGPSRAEVFDESGIRRGFVDLSPGSRLIGFGTGTEGGEVAYLTRTDSVGLKWLERHRILR